MRYNAWATVLIGLSALCWSSWRSRLVRALGIAIASVALLSLTTSCAVHRTATESSRFFAEQSGKAERRVEGSELRELETRDSLREEPTNEARAEPSLLELCLARRRKTTVKSLKI